MYFLFINYSSHDTQVVNWSIGFFFTFCTEAAIGHCFIAKKCVETETGDFFGRPKASIIFVKWDSCIIS